MFLNNSDFGHSGGNFNGFVLLEGSCSGSCSDWFQHDFNFQFQC